MDENRRKCFKCGCSPAEHNVKLFLFPKPGVRNLIRCLLWAKYIYPEGQYSSLQNQTKLYNDHKMLCEKHFKDTDFKDITKARLLRTAVPCDTENVLIDLAEPQAGPSQRISLGDITNIETVANKPETSTAKQTQTTNMTYTENVLINVEKSQAGPSHRLLANKAEVSDRQTQTTNKVKSEREKIMFAKCSKYMKQICYLRNRIKKLKPVAMINTISDDVAVKKLSEKITPTFAQLLQGQLSNFKKKYTGRRWSKQVKITALRIFKRSPTCYRLLRRLFHLPSPSTLRSLLNKVPFGVGVSQRVLNVLTKYVKTQKPSDNQYILMFDEMSLKKHLYYNTKDDIIEGYQDHASQGRSPLIAAYALVFMISGIRKRVKQPIAYYFSSGFSTADRLAVLIKEVLNQCFIAEINIAAIVCDMDGVNRRALTNLGASTQHPFITIHNNEVITIFDTPHLLKCFRNNFMKYDIECPTNISSDGKTGRGVAKWSYIKEFYEVDNRNPNFVFAPALKKEHLNPNSKQKMRVKLAAQVLSHSVAGGMYAKISAGELSADAIVTAEVINTMDKLFDSVNSDCSDLRRGKPYATNLRSTSAHLQLYKDVIYFFNNMNYVGSARTPPSTEGWIWTINGIVRLWRKLSSIHNIKSLSTRRLQQDPLENLFGCIRGNCGSNINPTCGQFVAGIKTAIISNLAHIGTGGNCEEDKNDTIINNFDTLLSVSQPICIRTEPGNETASETIQLPHNIEELVTEDSAEIQACAYVCGFLLNRFKNSCDNCKPMFVSENVDKHHQFVECREYSEVKKSLIYATKEMVTCVECCATVINQCLNEKSHVTNLKRDILENVKNVVNFNFLDNCAIHKEQNILNIIENVFIICTKRFCLLKNRLFAEESSAAALKRKMNIILHK